MVKRGMNFQLAPPHNHCRNVAERAIQTFKNHFIARLCSVHSNFPIQVWDKLLPQAVLTLNLLHPSQINQRLPAELQLNSIFDHNATPLAPPGIMVIVHEKPKVRTLWGAHGVDGWYVGPTHNHYRCYMVYIPTTKRDHIADTVEFFHHQFDLPTLDGKHAATSTALDLINILQNPAPPSPFLCIGDAQRAALKQLAIIFHEALPAHKQAVAPLNIPQQSVVPTPAHAPQ
eukprot:3584002-Ditylum_brightwellii.AAC.1